MEPLVLTATQFIKPMSAGRNHPLLLGCENADGGSFEVVVKLRGKEMDARAQMVELFTALLADDLGLQVPQAAIVAVPTGFESVVAEREAVALLNNSSGWNFGSVHLGAGFTTWPPGRNPVGAQRDQAADIFAFDTLIQNPDRRAVNPNLWARSDKLGIYDHEQAFSFLSHHIIGGTPKPWAAKSHGSAFRFLEQHLFYGNLRGGRLDLGPFKERLRALSDKKLKGYLDAVPAEWSGDGDFGGKIMEYLGEARQWREDLVNYVKHLLR